jgi:hypothetical protein
MAGLGKLGPSFGIYLLQRYIFCWPFVSSLIVIVCTYSIRSAHVYYSRTCTRHYVPRPCTRICMSIVHVPRHYVPRPCTRICMSIVHVPRHYVPRPCTRIIVHALMYSFHSSIVSALVFYHSLHS